MTPPTLCVALCTYNGSAFLPEQLESVAGQSRPPDRVVVVDDTSTDTTLQLLERFAGSVSFPVEIRVNERNLGFSKNFERAIAHSQGEVIVLSDQDDVWHPEKLARIEAAFGRSPAIGLVFSDAELVDAALRPLGYRLWEAVQLSAEMQAEIESGRLFELLVRGNFVTGATLAFRSEWRELVLPVETCSVHDAWLALLIAAVSDAALIPEPLICYRQHASNQMGMRKTHALERLARGRRVGQRDLTWHAAHLRAARERLAGYPGISRARLEYIQDAIAHLAVRTALPKSRIRRVPAISQELLRGRYRRLANGGWSALRDFLI
ncbi:MAG: glycosyltransferase family 2 protein [Longimicrobiaceae bacterium]